MKILFDKNNLLSIEHSGIPQLKEYTYNVGGMKISDYDKGIIVLHKKDIKVINLKNLGDGMSVVYLKKSKDNIGKLDNVAFKSSLGLFGGFDENTGNHYCFLPSISSKDLDKMNEKYNKLTKGIRLVSDKKGVLVEGCDKFDKIWKSKDEMLSFLFGLIILYGKFDMKGSELFSIKIQLPLFGQYLKYQETLDEMIITLQKCGIFLSKDVLTTGKGVVYQMSSNDRELMEILAKWYEAIEKFEKISKRDFTLEMKENLLNYLGNNKDIPEDGRKEVIEEIKDGVVKFLVKS